MHQPIQLENLQLKRLIELSERQVRQNFVQIEQNNHIIRLLRILVLEEEQPPLTNSVTNVFSGENMDNALVLNVGQSSIDTLTPRLADGVTPSGGTVSNVAVSFSDPSATATVNPDGTITFVGVAASTGQVSGSSSCEVTDTDGAVSKWGPIPFTVQVNALPPPSQLTQSVANVFSTPTP